MDICHRTSDRLATLCLWGKMVFFLISFSSPDIPIFFHLIHLPFYSLFFYISFHRTRPLLSVSSSSIFFILFSFSFLLSYSFLFPSHRSCSAHFLLDSFPILFLHIHPPLFLYFFFLFSFSPLLLLFLVLHIFFPT